MSLFVAVSVALLRFVAIFAFFGRLWAKLVFFLGQKKCFFCQKSVVCLLLKQSFLDKKCTVTWYLFHITLNKICKFAITRKNDAFAKVAFLWWYDTVDLFFLGGPKMEWIDYITSNTSKSLRCTINQGEYTNHRRFDKKSNFLQLVGSITTWGGGLLVPPKMIT